jgi:hypothetical protein
MGDIFRAAELTYMFLPAILINSTVQIWDFGGGGTEGIHFFEPQNKYPPPSSGWELECELRDPKLTSQFYQRFANLFQVRALFKGRPGPFQR